MFDLGCSITSLNTGGLKTPNKLDTAMLQYCKTWGADFSILQATHLGLAEYNTGQHNLSVRLKN